MPLLREDELLRKYNKHKASAKKKDKAPVIVPEQEAVQKDFKPELTDFVKYKSGKKGVRVEMPDRVQIIKAGFAKGFIEKVSKFPDKLVTWKDGKPAKFKGVSVRQDKDGYYCYTHRARSKSYPSPDKIPASKIKFIESTG